jgi:hypothetical protein
MQAVARPVLVLFSDPRNSKLQIRLSDRGLARFEVLGRDADRDLIRMLARRLAENGPESAKLGAASRQREEGREIDH